MDINTRRMNMAFPIIGQIRKGAAKQTKNRPDGSTYQTVGADLGSKFRVVFFPGHNGADQKFIKEYGSVYPERILAMLPFGQVDQAWQYWNEAYTAGRMVAQADESHFLIMRDPVTGEYGVKNGEPYTEYHPGMTIDYESKGKRISLPIKPTGRLRLWLPCFERMVMMELRTTSFYDCENVSNQLAAIAGMAETLNYGCVAGIPIWIYRRPTEITWNKPDGSASRVEKWLVNIEIDSEWVKLAYAKLRATAVHSLLPDRAPIAVLPTPADMRVEVPDGLVDPETDGDEADAIPDAVIAAGQIQLGNKSMSNLTNDELMLLSDRNSKAAPNIKEAAALIIDWRIVHGDN